MAKIGSLRLFESHASVTIYQRYQVPTNAIVPRDTIIQLPKSYLEGYFLKCLAARKRRAKPSRKRRKGRRKKEERTYANWQLEIATERNWSRLRGKLLKLHLTGNIKTHEYYYSFPPVSKIGHKELRTFRKHVYHEFHACQDAFYYVCRVYLFKRLDQYYQYITSINKNQILNINLSIIIA